MTSIRRLSFVAASALLGLVLSAQAIAQADPPGYEQRKANVVKGASGAALAAASPAGPAATVRGALRARGASEATAASLRETGSNTTRAGVTHLRMEQQVAGLTVYGRYVKAAVNARGELVNLIENVAPVPSTPPAEPRINAQRALQAAMARVHPGLQPAFDPSGAAGNTITFAGGSFFSSDPSVTRVAVPMSDGTLAVGYLVETWTARDNQLHHTLVSGDGRVLHVESRTARDSYNVFTIDPSKTPQAIVAGPGAGNAQSPAGWLGSGAQSTLGIAGNNVFAYLDADANNRADGGGAPVVSGDFLTAADLSASPSIATNRAVAVQNLFYLNNVIHDILYGHGFTEAAGNFQQDNFGKGGAGRDPVQAEAQDGSGTDNANFATPADGRPPRMQMFLWTGPGATHRVHVNAPAAADYAAMGAEFGPALTAAGITGALVSITVPADGCTAISTPLAGKVAVIDRGTCDFSLKALNAQNAGAVAVIIANNQGGTAIFTMGAGSSANRVRIPAVMVSQNDGVALHSTGGGPNVTVSKLAPQPLQLDSALDSDVVFHEYAHGLTWRMIGGMSGPLAGAVGEGMSDGIAMLVNGDDVIGEYSASNPLGIRRYRYDGYPRTYGSVTGAEVHDDGEPIAAIVWRMMELFGKNGRAQLFGYVVDGMNYTPSTPAYEDIRDGILQSIRQDPSAGNACSLVWRAFAQFGVGVGAQGTVLRDGTVQITESFTEGSCK